MRLLAHLLTCLLALPPQLRRVSCRIALLSSSATPMLAKLVALEKKMKKWWVGACDPAWLCERFQNII